jgi:hypothetical protein
MSQATLLTRHTLVAGLIVFKILIDYLGRLHNIVVGLIYDCQIPNYRNSTRTLWQPLPKVIHRPQTVLGGLSILSSMFTTMVTEAFDR